jgi:prepilin-type N-terminal cleavage/methylation domain-containing protein
MKLFARNQPQHTPGRRRKQAGFTLVELLMTMALMGIFVVVLTDMVSATMDVQTESAAVSAVSEDSRYILARLDYDIQRATSITTPAALGGSGASLALVIAGVTHTYAVSGGNLQLTDGSGTVNLNSNETTLSGVSFQRLGNSGGKETVRLSLTVTSIASTDQGQDSRSLTTTLGRRQ